MCMFVCASDKSDSSCKYKRSATTLNWRRFIYAFIFILLWDE